MIYFRPRLLRTTSLVVCAQRTRPEHRKQKTTQLYAKKKKPRKTSRTLYEHMNARVNISMRRDNAHMNTSVRHALIYAYLSLYDRVVPRPAGIRNNNNNVCSARSTLVTNAVMVHDVYGYRAHFV